MIVETSEIAARALEIMDRDGWCKGHFTALTSYPPRRDAKTPHCGGGIWSLACGYDTWADEEWFTPLWEKICELFPESAARAENFFSGVTMGGPQPSFIHTALARVVRWNDHFALEADVRTVFEKLAAG